VHLGAALGIGELAHGPLDRRLHREHLAGPRAEPEVEEPPVQPVLGPGVLIDRQRSRRQVLDRDVFRNDLEAPERDHRVLDDPPGDPHRRLGCQGVEHRVQPAPVAAVGDLRGAGVVADENELHRALQARRAHPARDRNGFSDVVAQLVDQDPSDHRKALPGPSAVIPGGRGRAG
jgi:hypothetical protein